MPINADEMPITAAFHCPWCSGMFTTNMKDYTPLKVRGAEIDILAVCPICGAICGTTVKRIHRKENI